MIRKTISANKAQKLTVCLEGHVFYRVYFKIPEKTFWIQGVRDPLGLIPAKVAEDLTLQNRIIKASENIWEIYRDRDTEIWHELLQKIQENEQFNI